MLQIMFKHTTLKKFVLPLLLAFLLQSTIMLSPADQADFSRYILRLSLNRTYPEALSMKQGLRSADWFIRKSKKGKPRKLEQAVNKVLVDKAAGLVSKLYPAGVKLAVDITKIPVYSKSKSKYITRGSAEKGTTRFYQFLGVSIIERQLKFPLSLRLMEQGDKQRLPHILYEMLSYVKNRMKIRLVALDRGFISSKIVIVLYRLGFSFVIAFRKSKKFKKLFNALDHPKVQAKDNFYFPSLKTRVHKKQKNCWVIYDYSYGNPSTKVNLVIWRARPRRRKSKKDTTTGHDYFLYITSPDVPVSMVYELYGTRWRIETAFRQIKSFQARTRVMHPTHRIWLFSVACLLYCSWVVRNLPKDADSILPEFLLTEELEKRYKQWMYGRIKVRELVDYYQRLLTQKSVAVF